MIGWNELFNFSGGQPLDEAIAKIQLLEDTYKGMIDSVVNSNKRLSTELGVVTESAKQLSASINQSNVSMAKYEEHIMNTAKDSEELMSKNIALKKTLDDNDKTLNSLTQGLKSATKAKDDLKSSTQAEAGSFNDLKKKLTDAENAYKKLGHSVDESVKEQHLQNVKEASAQYNQVNKALGEAKKSAIIAAGSYNEFSMRVADAKKQLKQMEGGLDGTSQEFKDLQKFVTEGTKKLKDWDNSIGDNQRNVGNYEGAIKDLKTQLKAAKDEMAGIAATLGADSKEFNEAALKAGALKDELDDIQKATKNVAGSKLENLSASFGDVFQKLKSGDFKGGLEAAKQFATVSKSISFKEAATSIKQFGQTIGTVGKAILTNPLFLLSAVIVGIVVALYKFRDSIPFVSKALEVVGEATDFVIQKLKDLTDWLGITTFAQQEKAKATQEAALKEIEVTKESADVQIRFAKALGKETVEIEKQKWKDVLDAANRGLMALTKGRTKWTDEEKERIEEFNKTIKEASIELTEILIKQGAERLAQQKFLHKIAERNRIEAKNTGAQTVQDQIDFYLTTKDMAINDVSTRLALMRAFGVDASKVQKDVSEKLRKEKLAQDQERFAEELAREQLHKDLLKQLYQSFWSTVSTMANNYSAGRIMNLEGELKALEENTKHQMILAGDNDKQKAQIEIQAEKRREALEKKILDEKIRQARFNKNLALAQATINTYQAVTNALAKEDYISALLYAALGALQIAGIESTPLPKYQFGTEDSVEGWAIINEKGKEIVVPRTGGAYTVDSQGPTLAYLQGGSKVIPADQSAELMQSNMFDDTKEFFRKGDYSINKYLVDRNDRAIVSALDRNLGGLVTSTKQIIEAIDRNAPPDYFEQGSMIMKNLKRKDGSKKRVWLKSMG